MCITLSCLRNKSSNAFSAFIFFSIEGVLSLGYPLKTRPSPAAHDPQTAARLWSFSEQMTGVRYALPPAE